MYTGKIIKFHRELANLTQEQLGKGICSATHISKIERGLTEYSSEITDLLAEKLKINLNHELSKIMNIKEKLDMWHEMIISLNMQAASEIQSELASNHLIAISEYETLYNFLSVKFNLKQGNISKVHKQMKKFPKKFKHLPPFEQNLYKHIIGIYHIVMDKHVEAVQTLKSIDFDTYSNALIYYDLAYAYHYNNSTVLAYYYAEKSLHLYKQKNNFLGIIDTENLMLIQIEADQNRDFKDTTEKYYDLIQLCDLCNSPDKKGKLLHNFAYQNLRRKKYEEAAALYKQSMDLKEKYTGIYLLSLEGYIRSGREGKLFSQEELLKYVHEGLEIANVLEDTVYIIVLTLSKYLILHREKQYYKYIVNTALPFLRKHGYIVTAKEYEQELFDYYTKIGEKDKALQIAQSIIHSNGAGQ